MTQRIVIAEPPLYSHIVEAFGVRPGDGVIYSWGDTVYNPDGVPIPPQVLAHEAVHGERQGTSTVAIVQWWKRYIESPRFRLAEEIPAHQAELKWWLEYGNRAERRAAVKVVAKRLASPLYGRLVGRSAAEAMLREGARA